jgi:hypothetical protein
MNIHRLAGAPDPRLARALERFEAQFTYPLGPGRSFRISHGDDYGRFFRAMGDAACFVAEADGRVHGVIGAALRRLEHPDGVARAVAYLGDLKVDPAVRGAATLVRLAHAVIDWIGSRAGAAFGVVMEGTRAMPDRYTGRLGIPPFRPIGRVAILRVPSLPAPLDTAWRAGERGGDAAFARLRAGRHSVLGGDPAERSAKAALWLVAPDGGACGRLEDTSLAKRLYADDGTEMRSAHLSCFAFRDARAGAALLRAARQLAAERGFPALFASVAEPEAGELARIVADDALVVAPAAIYGAGLEPGALWHINTAEI